MEFKNYFFENRKLLGKSQADVANVLGYSTNVIFRWEQGASLPSIEAVPAIAKLFNVPVREVIEHKEVNQYHEPVEIEPFDSEKFAIVLKERRKAKMMRQNNLSEITHVSISSISRFESGASIPNIDEFQLIAKAFEIDAMDLYHCKTDDIVKPAPIKRKRKNIIIPLVTGLSVLLVGGVTAGVLIPSLNKKNEAQQNEQPINNEPDDKGNEEIEPVDPLAELHAPYVSIDDDNPALQTNEIQDSVNYDDTFTRKFGYDIFWDNVLSLEKIFDAKDTDPVVEVDKDFNIVNDEFVFSKPIDETKEYFKLYTGSESGVEYLRESIRFLDIENNTNGLHSSINKKYGFGLKLKDNTASLIDREFDVYFRSTNEEKNISFSSTLKYDEKNDYFITYFDLPYYIPGGSYYLYCIKNKHNEASESFKNSIEFRNIYNFENEADLDSRYPLIYLDELKEDGYFKIRLRAYDDYSGIRAIRVMYYKESTINGKIIYDFVNDKDYELVHKKTILMVPEEESIQYTKCYLGVVDYAGNLYEEKRIDAEPFK